LKNKLEGQVQETHDELEKEKREKAEVEKVRRKLEGDLKTTQEQVDNINRAKEELERTLSGYVCYQSFTGYWFMVSDTSCYA
jgi:myosin heavy chain 6/7